MYNTKYLSSRKPTILENTFLTEMDGQIKDFIKCCVLNKVEIPNIPAEPKLQQFQGNGFCPSTQPS